MEPVTVGIIGCGVISEVYMKNLSSCFSGVRIKSCADYLSGKSNIRAKQFGVLSVTPEDLLADPEIQVVLNLTNPAAHADVSLAALQAGKHVYSEKPLATDLAAAKQILSLAEEKGLKVGCAPDTILGAGLQTALKGISDGWIGRPLSACAFYTCRGHERWHSSPAFYYQPGGGPHMDMGPYYITALVAALGNVKRVSAMSNAGFSQRFFGVGDHKGERFPVAVDTHYSALLEFDSGCIATVMLSFDIWAANLPRLEIYGTGGSMSLPDPNFFDGPVGVKGIGSDGFTQLPLLNPFHENLRGIGLAQMCKAIREGGEPLVNAQLAAHVLEVLLALEISAESGTMVTCETTCQRPPLLDSGLPAVEYGL